MTVTMHQVISAGQEGKHGCEGVQRVMGPRLCRPQTVDKMYSVSGAKVKALEVHTQTWVKTPTARTSPTASKAEWHMLKGRCSEFLFFLTIKILPFSITPQKKRQYHLNRPHILPLQIMDY